MAHVSRSCRVEVSIAIKWMKRTMLKKVIAGKATNEARDGCEFWASLVHAALLEREQIPSEPTHRREDSDSMSSTAFELFQSGAATEMVSMLASVIEHESLAT